MNLSFQFFRMKRPVTKPAGKLVGVLSFLFACFVACADAGNAVWDNESFVTPYGLPTPTAGFTNLEAVVKGMGIPKAKTVRSLDEFEGALKEMLGASETAVLIAKLDKSIATNLAAYPFGLTENGISFRRALVDQGLVDPFHAGASLPKTMEFKF